MRKTQFANNEYYHIFNRGVDKREIFSEYDDLSRFFQSMDEFNIIDPIGSIFENFFRKIERPVSENERLVNFTCYCLNPNHYHFILKQVSDKGIEKFMQRLGNGYTKYFNNKHGRSGSLFQGTYKSVHINSNEYLLHLSVYVNLNNKIHQLGDSVSKSKSSWEEYVNPSICGFCEKDIVLGQFNNFSEYQEFAESSFENIKERKELEKLLLE
ncbi:transposase [Patescibacteria group bacterium]|nr:transposase [Patescibacteria group bacterium]